MARPAASRLLRLCSRGAAAASPRGARGGGRDHAGSSSGRRTPRVRGTDTRQPALRRPALTPTSTPPCTSLSNLSFADLCFTSTTIPKMLLNIQMQSKAITYGECLTQMYFYILFGVLDNFLLTVMAYDRFVAICHPLHYMVILNLKFCGILLLASWLLTVLNSSLHVLMVLRLSFCTNLEIPHFFCEVNQVVQLACSDTFLNDIFIYFSAGLLGIIPLTGILYSYSKIVSSVLKISSASGKYKAFSTCGSHLTVVSLFYGTAVGVYLSSAALENSRFSAVTSVMYTVVTPMLNPFIYSLRNNDIKQAIIKFFRNTTVLRNITFEHHPDLLVISNVLSQL
ncbi:LOW QUALITY PROTEIN: olfactory receptor 1571-like [Suncus etruscus]|uniref:LOW QUALITY PROTEIN: olfactory receptor 1571-like n=1 Tax=Suncus etruscus TaxID=109475 RepID=UPI00210F4173|nr:LOW QUALITY PROTEIN: olfactory receptor 1571-like [Suncus etruscus]